MSLSDLAFYSGNNVQKQLLIDSVTVSIPSTAPFTPTIVLTVPTGLTYVPVARMSLTYGGKKGVTLDALINMDVFVSAYIDSSFNFVATATNGSGGTVTDVTINYRIYADQ